MLDFSKEVTADDRRSGPTTNTQRAIAPTVANTSRSSILDRSRIVRLARVKP
jgi:hypothetical protein